MTDVRLPTGEIVAISRTPADWWLRHGASGYVEPSQLLPDPEQPRKQLTGPDWHEFVESIRISGVREYIIVTPRSLAPWVIVPSNSTCPFIIVSGHRRHRGADEAAVLAVPVIVRIYANEKAYREDADERNTNRKDLTPLEEAIEIQRRYQAGDTIEMIAKKRGMAIPTCAGRLKLLKLAPEIRERIDPTVRQGKRTEFPINVASALGTLSDLEPQSFLNLMTKFDLGKPEIIQSDGDSKLDYAIQRMVLAHIEDRSMAAPEAIEFIKNGRREAGHGRISKTAIRSSSKTLKALENCVRGPIRATTTTATRADLRRACSDLTPDEISVRISWAKDSMAELAKLAGLLESIHSDRISHQVAPAPQFTPSAPRTVSPEVAKEVAERYGVSLKL